MSSSNPYAAKSVTPREDTPVLVVSAPPAAPDVPAGPIKTVIDYVGSDVKRAKTVLRGERAGRDRKRIITTLEAIVAKDLKERER